MKLKFDSTEEIMWLQVVYLFFIIYIVNFYFESFLLLEMVIHCDFLNPLGVQSIMDNFSSANFDPHLPLLFEKYQKRIWKTKSIHVW